MDAITLEVMRNRFFAITEEMGAALIRTAYSTNIKDRRDCSCALFDVNGETIAQAEHIPVHSGVLPSDFFQCGFLQFQKQQYLSSPILLAENKQTPAHSKKHNGKSPVWFSE